MKKLQALMESTLASNERFSAQVGEPTSPVVRVSNSLYEANLIDVLFIMKRYAALSESQREALDEMLAGELAVDSTGLKRAMQESIGGLNKQLDQTLGLSEGPRELPKRLHKTECDQVPADQGSEVQVVRYDPYTESPFVAELPAMAGDSGEYDVEIDSYDDEYDDDEEDDYDDEEEEYIIDDFDDYYDIDDEGLGPDYYSEDDEDEDEGEDDDDEDEDGEGEKRKKGKCKCGCKECG